MLATRCSDSACAAPIKAPLARAGAVAIDCPRCGRPAALDIPAELAENHRVARCPCCGGVEFFIRKDFPQKLGLGLVVLFGLVATAFFAWRNIPATFITLAALVAVDAVIYLFVGRVTVCYRCRAEFRGVAYNPDHGPFDLATSEKYG